MVGCGSSVGVGGRGSTADRTPRGMPHRRRGRKANCRPCTPNDGAALLRTPDRRWNHSAERLSVRVDTQSKFNQQREVATGTPEQVSNGVPHAHPSVSACPATRAHDGANLLRASPIGLRPAFGDWAANVDPAPLRSWLLGDASEGYQKR